MDELDKRKAALSPAKRALLEQRLKATGSRVGHKEIRRSIQQGPSPLSFNQERLWFLYQLEPDSPAYNLPTWLRFEGELKVAAIRRSVNEVLRRHEILRTRIEAVEGRPMQVVEPFRRLEIPLLDLSGLPAQQREAEAKRLCMQEARKPFNLARDLMLRANLFRLGQSEHVLFLNRHHIASDGWSWGVLMRELETLYQAFSKEEPSPLAELPVQYADFAIWQRAWLQGDVLEKQLGYWRKELDDAPASLELPTDRRAPATPTYCGALLSYDLPESLSLAVGELSRREGVTLFMTLLAAFQTLLHRYTSRDDILVGSVVAGRSRTEVEGLIGFFANTLVLRGDLSGDPSFRDILQRTRTVCVGAYAHQDMPFGELVKQLQPERGMSHSPLFQVMFVLQNAPVAAMTIPGLRVTATDWLDTGASKFELSLSVKESGNSLNAAVEYRTDLFDAATIRRMLNHYQTLLEGIAVNPDTRLSELPLLTALEREQIVMEWNQTETKYPKERCVHELFAEQAARTPDEVAVVHEERQLSYAELNAQANQLAQYLRELGVRPDDRVAICVERSLAMVVGLLAVLKAGGAYVPLDPSYPAERLSYMLSDSTPKVLLTQSGLEGILKDVPATLAVLDLTAKQVPWANRSTANIERAQLGLRPDHLAYVIYTSGSTGRPKGVAMPHRPLVNLIHWQIALGSEKKLQRTLQFAALGFDVSFQEIFSTLCAGAVLALINHDIRLNPAKLLDHICTNGIQRLYLPYVALQAVAEAAIRIDEEEFEKPKCVLEDIITAGEQLRISPQIAAFFTRLAHCRLHNHYGPTESHVTTALVLPTQVTNWPILPSVGRPIANTQIYILDGCGQPVPIGVAGEIHISGAGVARGYLNRPELTAERFVKDPFTTDASARMYKTGDLGRWLADGTIEFLGRNDFQVKVRGFRVELGEIEARLVEHPGVREAVVIAREDSTGDKRLVVYYVAADATCKEASPNAEMVGAEGLRNHLLAQLPEYMVPAAYVRLESLPLTPNGKLDRKALPAPEAQAHAVGGYEAPQGEIETTLAQIWAELLKLERVGRHDNFFALGGHSLLAVQVISRVRQSRGVDITVSEMFTKPVLVDFARRVSEAGANTLPPITPVEGDERLALSFAQQRLWFLVQLGEEVSAAYHMRLGLRLIGELERGALRQALDRLVERHEVLRTRFIQVDGQPVQSIAPAANSHFVLLEHDVSTQPDGAAEVARLVAQEASAPFDLEQGPLIRGRLVCEGEQAHTLLITMHHIVSDGWSMGVLVNELSALYRAYRQGEADPLPPLSVQYADYAAWQRRWVTGEVLQEQSDYWKATLAGAPTLLELPTDRPRPLQQDYAGALIECVLDAELTKSLKALSQRHGTTLFMTLVASWAALLARLSGQEEVVIGTPSANRGRREIEGLIGFFVNTLALRVDVSGSLTVGELLERVKAQALAAQQHQDLPFEQVVEITRPERSLAHSPLFQVMFTWQNAPKGTLELPGLRLAPLEAAPHVTAKFDLSLSLAEVGERIEGKIQYVTALFDRSTMERYLGHWRTLMAAMVADDRQRVDRLPLLTEAERYQVLEAWNHTRAEYPSQECIHELFEAQVARTPDAVAVVHEERQLSYSELNAQANQLAHHLRGLGVRPDDLVAICVERSLAMVVGLLAVLKAGGAYVPLDPSYPKERLAFMLEDTRAKAVLSQEKLRELLPQSDLKVISLDGQWAEIAQYSTEPIASGVKPQNLAYVIYTSGSTGTPKGVMVEHRAIVRLVCKSDYITIDSNDRVAQISNSSFDAIAFELWGALLNGASLVVISRATSLDPVLFAEAITKRSISTLFLTTALFNRIAVECPSVFGTLDNVLFGGEAADIESVTRVLGKGQPGRLINVYGPTENTTFSTWHLIESITDTVPIGKPIANTRVYVLDSKLRPVPVGVAGELHLAGDGLARGYLNRPELTADKFIPNPLAEEPGDRLYRTGDLARWRADGELEFLGRMDQQVKIRGYRIELGEIESVLRQHEQVKQCAVLAREDRPGDKRLVAYLIPKKKAGPNIVVGSFRRYLKGKLPDYMVPPHFVVLESLPLTPNGKLDLKALPEPELDRIDLLAEYVEPLAPMEKALAEIWAKVLGVKRVGLNDNFFELGGHSLLAVRLFSQIEKSLGHKLPIASLFRAPTIAALAALIHEPGRNYGWSPLMPIQPRGNRLPFFAVHCGFGQVLFYRPLAQLLGPDQPFYGFQSEGLDGRPFKHTSIEAIAEYYIEAMRGVQPHGPYFLGGYCMGGMIAFEMAQQLHAEGEEIALLVLFDAQNPAQPPQRYTRVERVKLRFQYGSRLAPAEQIRYFASQLDGHLKKWQERFKKMRYRMLNIDVDAGVVPDEFRQLHVVLSLQRARDAYKPRVYPGRVTLFRATTPGQYFCYTADYIADFGWTKLAGGGLEIHPVPGNHVSMFGESNIGMTAEKLRGLLRLSKQSV